MSEFKLLEVKKITADINQPRKFFDTSAMAELVESIKTNGVLQPILVRPKGKGYMLVCGERRYRATKEAGLIEVPAVIREMTDGEALEAQIIENLQRKDVHPMEEAVAFKSLIESKKYSIIEVSARIGKKDWFVKQRLKLNDLTESWQQVFFSNKMSLKDALQIAQLSVIAQNDLFDNQDNVNEPNYRLDLSAWLLNKYKGNLSDASFDLSDPNIDTKVGACTNCQFNTAAAQLFPDDDKSPRCTNVICFKNKTDIHFIDELSKAKEDPEVLFINDGYNETAFVKQLKKEGLNVLKEYDEFNEIDIPEKPDWEVHKDNYDDDTEEIELKEKFEKLMVNYEKKLADYNKSIATGKFKKAFVVDGNDKGKYTYIELKKSTSRNQSKSALADSDEISVTDIDEEIGRIKIREARLKELDQVKVWDNIKPHFNPHANASLLKEDFTEVEREAIAWAMFNKLSYHERDKFRSLFKIKKESFAHVNEITLRQMTRFFFLNTLPPSAIYNGFTPDALVCIKVAGEYFPAVLEEITNKQKVAADKRGVKVAAKLKDLQEQKKLLKKDAKTKVK